MARQLSMDLYLKHLKKQYVGADRKTKSHLLTELCRVGGYHRKYAIELLSGHMPKVNYGRRKRGKKKTYRPEGLMAPLKQIWFATDQMCGRRQQFPAN